jgi:DnaJ-class molecular chaperone
MNQQNRLQPRSYYDVLGVDKTASTEDIKRRFHILSLMLHPDKTNGVTKEQFQLIQEAWEVLKDPQKRCKYDMNLGMLSENNDLLKTTFMALDSFQMVTMAYRKLTKNTPIRHGPYF